MFSTVHRGEVSLCELIDITIDRMKKSDITYIVFDISPG